MSFSHFFGEKWCVKLRVSPIKEFRPNFITLRITIHFWLPWLLFTDFCHTFSTVSYLDMLFRTKKNCRYNIESGMRNISPRNRLFFSLIWCISPLNIMILSWKLYHNFSIPVPISSPNFSSFEFSWAEIEFWREWLKCFSIFLNPWFFELLTNFSCFRLIQYIQFFFVCLKEHIETRGTTEPFFWIRLSFIGYKDVYVTR